MFGRWTVNVNDKTESKFRSEVGKRLGSRKGNLGKALDQALQLWIAHPELVEGAKQK